MVIFPVDGVSFSTVSVVDGGRRGEAGVTGGTPNRGDKLGNLGVAGILLLPLLVVVVALLLGGRGNFVPALLRGVADDDVVAVVVDEKEGGNLNFLAAVRLRRSSVAEGGGKGNLLVLADLGDIVVIGFLLVL